ncbi:MAG: hypothetical protein EOP84_25180 [Verrucomicrobiaceae bacterium]|nr:MAG: hypothetical protein EOP84_25180 [Verrucomicrobiaceae bacterium]
MKKLIRLAAVAVVIAGMCYVLLENKGQGRFGYVRIAANVGSWLGSNEVNEIDYEDAIRNHGMAKLVGAADAGNANAQLFVARA